MKLLNILSEIIKLDEQYQGDHQAPNRYGDSPMHDLSGAYPDDIYSNNAGRLYGDFSDEYSDNESLSIIKYARNKPNAQIKIYRAVPDINKETNKEIKKLTDITSYYNHWGFFPRKNDIVYALEDKYETIDDYDERRKAVLNHIYGEIENIKKSKSTPIKINDGDWVTINRNYAKSHGKHNLNNKFKIITKTVRAKDLYTDGNSIHEWGYSPG